MLTPAMVTPTMAMRTTTLPGLRNSNRNHGIRHINRLLRLGRTATKLAPGPCLGVNKTRGRATRGYCMTMEICRFGTDNH
jgi:hypothetical protein